MAYFLLSFANIYGNALKKQSDYFAFRTNLIVSDLGKVISPNASAMVHFRTFEINHPVAGRFRQKYGAITRIIPAFNMQTHFAEDYQWSGLCEFVDMANAKVVIQNAYHKIERVRVCYIITLK